MSDFWTGGRVCVTGGAGFLGSVVVSRLAEYGAGEIIAPRRSDYDLIKGNDVRRLLNDTQPDVILHFAANVGGIGANRAHPEEFLQVHRSQGCRGGFGFNTSTPLDEGLRETVDWFSAPSPPPRGNHASLRHPQWGTLDTR